MKHKGGRPRTLGDSTRLTVRIEDAQLDELERHAIKRGVPRSEVLRELIARFLERSHK